MKFAVSFLLTIVCGAALVEGHGYLLWPPGRASVWRHNSDALPNYDDNSLFCGGSAVWLANGMRCGECGDAYNGVRFHQPGIGNSYANGIIVDTYEAGQVIDVEVQVTANHLGWFEFRLCDNNNVNQRVKQSCLDQNLLTIAGTGGSTRFQIPANTVQFPGEPIKLQLQLPADLTCSQCVMQWRWRSQITLELYQNCADISITNSNGVVPPKPIVTAGPSTANPGIIAPENLVRTTKAPTTTQEPATIEPMPTGPMVIKTYKNCMPNLEQSFTIEPNKWCNDNCHHDPPYCPADYCTCTTYFYMSPVA